MGKDISSVITCENKREILNVSIELDSFETRMGNFPITEKTPVELTITNQENKRLSDQAENMRLSILGKDQKVKDDKPLEVVDAYVRENTADILDPIGAMDKMQEWKEYIDSFLSEIDTRIKVSNATTTIEF